jgi:hypothetical protein
LFKIPQHLLEKFHAIFKSYFSDKYFFIKQRDVITEKSNLLGKCPGSVIYLLYTADLPANINVFIAIFMDDTALFAIHKIPT